MSLRIDGFPDELSGFPGEDLGALRPKFLRFKIGSKVVGRKPPPKKPADDDLLPLSEEPAPKKKGPPWLLIGGAVLAAAGLGWFLFGRRGKGGASPLAVS